MIPDLALELLRRNARLRAWRAVGVPVEGGWVLAWRVVAEKRAPWLEVRCASCTYGNSGFSLDRETRLEETEQRLIYDLVIPPWPSKGYACPHLAPLLGDDPPEVKAIAELELLSLG